MSFYRVSSAATHPGLLQCLAADTTWCTAQQTLWSSTWSSSTRSASSSRGRWLGCGSDWQFPGSRHQGIQGGAGAAAAGPGAPETGGSMEASLPPVPSVALVWGSELPSPDPPTAPDSCFTPRLTGPGPSSRVVMTKSEVWSCPALGEKVREKRKHNDCGLIWKKMEKNLFDGLKEWSLL